MKSLPRHPRAIRHVVCAALTLNAAVFTVARAQFTPPAAKPASGANLRMVKPSTRPGDYVPVWTDGYDACLRRQAAIEMTTTGAENEETSFVVEMAADECALAVPGDGLLSERDQHKQQLAETLLAWRAAPLPTTFRPDCDVAALKPAYPRGAAISEAQGRTTVTVFVNEEGQVVDTRLVRASGPTYAHLLLDMASAKAAARCRFKAAPGVPRRAGNVVFDWRLM